MVEHGEDLTLILDMIDLLRLQYFNFLKNLGGIKLISLPMLDQSNTSEGTFLIEIIPTPVVPSTS